MGLAEIFIINQKNETIDVYGDIPAEFGGFLPLNGIKGYIVHSYPSHACSPILPPPIILQNYSDLSNSTKWIVLIERNGCDFDYKVLNAQRAGYSLAIVYNFESDDLVSMHGFRYVKMIRIPAVFIGWTAGIRIMKSYTYKSGYMIKVLDELPINLNNYLLPFAIVIAISFVVMSTFLITRCVRERRYRMRNRLSARNLKAIPTKRYKIGDELDTCAVCLEDYNDGEKLRILPCSHVYHSRCIDPWLTKNKRSCPICKRKIVVGRKHKNKPSPGRKSRQTSQILTSDSQPTLSHNPSTSTNHLESIVVNERTPLLSATNNRNHIGTNTIINNDGIVTSPLSLRSDNNQFISYLPTNNKLNYLNRFKLKPRQISPPPINVNLDNEQECNYIENNFTNNLDNGNSTLLSKFHVGAKKLGKMLLPKPNVIVPQQNTATISTSNVTSSSIDSISNFRLDLRDHIQNCKPQSQNLGTANESYIPEGENKVYGFERADIEQQKEPQAFAKTIYGSGGKTLITGPYKYNGHISNTYNSQVEALTPSSGSDDARHNHRYSNNEMDGNSIGSSRSNFSTSTTDSTQDSQHSFNEDSDNAENDVISTEDTANSHQGVSSHPYEIIDYRPNAATKFKRSKLTPSLLAMHYYGKKNNINFSHHKDENILDRIDGHVMIKGSKPLPTSQHPKAKINVMESTPFKTSTPNPNQPINNNHHSKIIEFSQQHQQPTLTDLLVGLDMLQKQQDSKHNINENNDEEEYFARSFGDRRNSFIRSTLSQETKNGNTINIVDVDGNYREILSNSTFFTAIEPPSSAKKRLNDCNESQSTIINKTTHYISNPKPRIEKQLVNLPKQISMENTILNDEHHQIIPGTDITDSHYLSTDDMIDKRELKNKIDHNTENHDEKSRFFIH